MTSTCSEILLIRHLSQWVEKGDERYDSKEGHTLSVTIGELYYGLHISLGRGKHLFILTLAT